MTDKDGHGGGGPLRDMISPDRKVDSHALPRDRVTIIDTVHGWKKRADALLNADQNPPPHVMGVHTR